MLRIGLFGGSFDPVHLGHLLVAQAACEELQLDKLFFIPAAQSPFKPERALAPGPARLRLLRLALAGNTMCAVDDQELKRGGISFTIDTVLEYRRRYPEAKLFYLIGADHVCSLPGWHRADELAQLVEFVVMHRPGAEFTGLPPTFRVRVLKGFVVGISSSQIRERVRAGLTIEHLVPPAVAEAITNDRLYV
ncbi:MAG: nicotinate (nicotinamide) nucleotide adenylyltransferase [Verrucomicrobiae bacterium]|nr:nicotinate (nicotinamide) nucleotide adenylyltransferase [Verrucomicrobiae bacterium]